MRKKNKVGIRIIFANKTQSLKDETVETKLFYNNFFF